MKRFCSLILALCLLAVTLFACACGKEKEPAEPNTVTITFPEGYTVTQYASLLEKNGVCSASAFMEACKTIPEGYEELLSGTSQDGRVFALEGYLFPDTYEFYKNESVSSVLARFLKNTRSKLGTDTLAQAEALGISVDQLLTFASVIQAECSIASEMPHVASVFHNRLQSSSFPYLGSDVTRQYIEQKMKSYITTCNETTPGTYDYNTLFGNYCTNDSYTYKRSGLPIGPVGNPGSEAIAAALNPSTTSDYYFFTDADGGFHYYTNYKDFQTEWNTKYKH